MIRILQEGKLGYLLVESDRRETAAVLEGIRLMSDCSMCDILSKDNRSNNINTPELSLIHI